MTWDFCTIGMHESVACNTKSGRTWHSKAGCVLLLVHTWASCTCLSMLQWQGRFFWQYPKLDFRRILWELFKGSSPADRDLSCREYLIHRAGSEGKLLLLSRLKWSDATLMLRYMNEIQFRCLQSLQYVRNQTIINTYWSTAPSLTNQILYIHSTTWSAILRTYFAGCWTMSR